MRIIAVKTLKKYWNKYPQAKQSLMAWYDEAENEDWNSPAELKKRYPIASVLNSKRAVFNINGNSFRLIVDIEYSLKIVFVVWFGTHADYDKIDAKKINYVKSH